MNQIKLNELAAEMMNGCPEENRAEHEIIAAALRAGDVDGALMGAGESLPETYTWLKSEIAAIA